MTNEALLEHILAGPPVEDRAALMSRKRRDELARLEHQLEDRTAALHAQQSAGPADDPRIEAIQAEIRGLEQQLTERGHLGVVEGIDPTDLGQAGWGMILPAHSDPAVVEALFELLELRKAQAGPRFRMYQGRTGYRAGESKARFLARNKADPSGPAEPDQMPYYLMLVGSPEEIPYSFQYQLDVQYAVGRIWFPTLEEYANYARSVVEAETHGIPRARQVSLFGVHNDDDPATELSARLLVEPLYERLGASSRGWDTRLFLGAEATRSRLATLLGGDQTPALLFTAGHGMGFPLDHPRQRAHQGALLCADWPGPEEWTGEIPEDFYLAGTHLGSDADVAGMMVFCFACFGAGTPQHDAFGSKGSGSRPRALASSPFVSALPTALLGRPRGALAVVGHVDRTWGCTFTGGSHRRSHTTTFHSTIERLLDEQPVGHALDYFNARYAELSTELSEELQDDFKEHDPYALAALWTANNDARGYVVLGDPAARLGFLGAATRSVATETAATELTSTELTSTPASSSTHFARPASALEQSVSERPPRVAEADWASASPAIRQCIAELRAKVLHLEDELRRYGRGPQEE